MTSQNNSGYIFSTGSHGKPDHVRIAERALGRRLPKGAEVHHVDGNKQNNTNSNLVICPNESYHRLLHTRTAAFDACGNVNFRPCRFCREYDDPGNMLKVSHYSYGHPSCLSRDRKDRRARRKAERMQSNGT